MSRRLSWIVPVVAQVPLISPAFAQAVNGPEASEQDEADCRRKQEAALISGEIVVCGTGQDDSRYRLQDRDAAQTRFAEETQRRGLGLAPDFAPPPCRPNLLTFCPKFGPVGAPALIVDLSQLPQAPAGSDADRIARGEVPQ